MLKKLINIIMIFCMAFMFTNVFAAETNACNNLIGIWKGQVTDIKGQTTPIRVTITGMLEETDPEYFPEGAMSWEENNHISFRSTTCSTVNNGKSISVLELWSQGNGSASLDVIAFTSRGNFNNPANPTQIQFFAGDINGALVKSGSISKISY